MFLIQQIRYVEEDIINKHRNYFQLLVYDNKQLSRESGVKSLLG